jgi:tetratricopeptide (TPR) repeat protein
VGAVLGYKGMTMPASIEILQYIVWLVIFAIVVRWILMILLINRGAKLLYDNQFNKADTLFTRMLKFYPKNALLHFLKAQSDTRKGDNNAALAHYDKAISLEQNNESLRGRSQVARGYFYLYLGRYDDALTDYRLVRELDVKPYLYHAYWGRVAVYFYQKLYEFALVEAQANLAIIEEGLSLTGGRRKPKFYERLKVSYLITCQFKALTLVELGYSQEAKDVFTMLSDKYGNNIFFYLGRAGLFFLLTEYALALADYEHSISLFTPIVKRGYVTASGYSLYHLESFGYAVTLFACGEIEQAQAQWREIQAKAPSLTSAERVGKEFFWSEAMTAKAKELEASFM